MEASAAAFLTTVLGSLLGAPLRAVLCGRRPHSARRVAAAAAARDTFGDRLRGRLSGAPRPPYCVAPRPLDGLAPRPPLYREAPRPLYRPKGRALPNHVGFLVHGRALDWLLRSAWRQAQLLPAAVART